MKLLKQPRKLAELRAKTDRQLQEVIDIHLSRGLAYIRQMAEADSRGLFQTATKFCSLASRECAQSERLQQLLDAKGKTSQTAAARCRQLREYLASASSAVRSACA